MTTANPDELKVKLAKAKLTRAKAAMNWALKSESAKLINGMLDLARSESGVPVLAPELDRDPWLFNVANGTLDLRTGELREHRREDLLTKLCPTEYDPKALCPAWLAFLDAVFERDDAIITFIRRLLGRCLTGDVTEDVFPIFYGTGANGKTTLINAVLRTIGADYAMKARTELVLRSYGERHPTEVADLFGRRLVVVSETPEGGRLNEALVKDLTGGEQLRGRRMREDFWGFMPTHKLVMLTNHRPVVAGTDEGIWRRLRLVPFTVKFWDPDVVPPEARGKDFPPELMQDKGMEEKLAAEAPGILAWLVEGCLGWRREGLTAPAKVAGATREYRDSEDVVLQFIAERCETGSTELRCKLGALYAAYKAWNEAAGGRPLGSKTFSQSLLSRGFQTHRSNGIWYLGVALRPQEDENEGRFPG